MIKREDLFDVLTSPNEMDRNGETANLVDGLFAISRAIHHLADVLEAGLSHGRDGTPADVMIAEAIEGLATATVEGK